MNSHIIEFLCIIISTEETCMYLAAIGIIKFLSFSVVHRITVEPITEQSMQYNDIYVPRDPTQSKLLKTLRT